MKDINENAFISLFKEACEKCFGYPLVTPLSETDSKVLATRIFEQTGLTIGVKSIKNYSIYVVNRDGKKENPSPATLDTLARYVLDAPPTNDIERKEREDHHPYWVDYRTRFTTSGTPVRTQHTGTIKSALIFLSVVCMLALMFAIARLLMHTNQPKTIAESFSSVSHDSLTANGWFVRHVSPSWWNRRDRVPGALTLYTLRGDNWYDGVDSNRVKNVVARPVPAACFTTEVHFDNFFPAKNWQQAGILLSEDSSFTGKVIRLSISYNDFFGGYESPPEIIIQGVSSSEGGARTKPEEFIHMPLFTVPRGQEEIVRKNLARAALKIEKHGRHFRFLYTSGTLERFAFREASSKDFNLQPHFIGLFAMQGLSNDESPLPVSITAFSLDEIPCTK